MRATIKDIAEKVGVSKSLVSMYLNNHPLSARIADKTKNKIDEAVKEMDYRPSLTARALKNGKSRTIGLVIGDIASVFSAFYSQAVLNEAVKYDYQLLISITRYNQDEEKRCLENLINRQADGIHYNMSLVPNERTRSLLKNYPILQAGSYVCPEYDSFAVEYKSALEEAFRFLKRRGCKRIGGFFSSFLNPWFDMCVELCLRYDMEFFLIDYNIFVSQKEVHQAFMDKKIECVISGSSVPSSRYFNYCMENKIQNIPDFIYSYTLPCDFIRHNALIGVLMHPLKSLVQQRMARMIEMIEHPKTEVEHLSTPSCFLDRDRLEKYYREQAADPYYATIINERGNLLNKKDFTK